MVGIELREVYRMRDKGKWTMPAELVDYSQKAQRSFKDLDKELCDDTLMRMRDHQIKELEQSEDGIYNWSER
jgi:hypothetical protein